MIDTLQNYVFKDEPVAFYPCASFDSKAGVAGQLTVTEQVQVTGTLFGLSSFLQGMFEQAPTREGRFRKIPELRGCILKTGQPFYCLIILKRELITQMDSDLHDYLRLLWK